MLAAGPEAFDPEEAYRVGLMTGPRERVQDKEAELSYVRNAQGYEMTAAADLVTYYPAVLNAFDRLGEPPDTALKRIAVLLQRHRQSVATVMRKELAAGRQNEFSANSLPSHYGAMQPAQVLPHTQVASYLAFDRKRNLVVINDAITVKGTAYHLLESLADEHLVGAGLVSDLLDYRMLNAGKLTDRLELRDQNALRQPGSRSRKQLRKQFSSADLKAEDGEALIENIPWSGYRLNPERERVRMHSPE